MDTLKEEFDAFKSSISRMRWFMITAVLVSVLILLHIYLEQLGFQDRQLATVFAHRVEDRVAPTQRCYEDLARYLQDKADGMQAEFPTKSCSEGLIPKARLEKVLALSRQDLLKEYSRQEYAIRITDNTIKNGKLQIRQIPMLGVEVPANDFVTVMSMMSLVFVIGVWINLNGVKAALVALASRKDPEVLRIAKLNTLFLTALETERGHVLGKAARALVIWLPFVSIIVATVLGYREVFVKLVSGSQWHFGPMELVLTHLLVAAVVILLHLWVAVECKFVLKDIDSQFSTTAT